MNYYSIELKKELEEVLRQKGFEKLTEIQQRAIPIIKNEEDVIGLSQTGTGKTLAFVLPILEKIQEDVDFVQALILAPTRELAQQIKQEIKEYSIKLRYIRPVCVYGGADIKQQIFSLKRRPNIVIGTPGRVLDHIRRHTLKLQNVNTFVLDEADEMFNMGFRNDIITIISKLKEERQTLLFSATMNDEVLDLSKNYMVNPKTIVVGKKNTTLDSIKQTYFFVPKDKKKKALHAILLELERGKTLIFCNTKNMVSVVQSYLNKIGYKVSVLHGDMPQAKRTKVMADFKQNKIDILITTDVAARGIDVNDIMYVINFDLPQNLEYYVHRIGRTGRAGKVGYAYTIINTDDQQRKVKELEKKLATKIELKRIQLDNLEETKQTKSLIQEKTRPRRRFNTKKVFKK